MKALRLILFVVILAGIAVAFLLLPVRAWMVELVTYIRDAGPAGVAVYAAVYVAVAVFMLPGSMMTIAAGFAYGPVLGTAINVTLAAVAAVPPFLLGRFVLRDFVAKRALRYPKFAAIDAATGQHGFKVVALLRASLAPYNFLNYALALTRVSLKDFVLGTFVGMIPAVTVLCYFGSLITDAAQLGVSLPGARVLYLGGFVTTVVGVVLLTRMAQRALKNVLSASSSSSSSSAPVQPHPPAP